MRLPLAALAVFAALFAVVSLLGEIDVFETLPPALVGGALGVFLVASIYVAFRVFNPRGAHPFGFVPFEEQVRRMEEAGLLAATDHRAVRALAVEEFEDEGSHYFVALADGGVLFLTGQYLYETDPIPEENRPRRFPCTDFSVRRHRDGGFAVDVVCRGEVLEPEVTVPSAALFEAFGEDLPEDGEVLADSTFDELRARFTAPA